MDVDVWGNHGSFDFWVFGVNNIGVITWNKCYGGSDYDEYGSMDVTSDGGFVLAGGTFSNNGDVSGNHGSSDFWLVKTDGNGNFQWAACYGGTGYEKAFDIKQTQDGGYILVGLTDSNDGQVTGNHSAYYDGWVVKTGPDFGRGWARRIADNLMGA